MISRSLSQRISSQAGLSTVGTCRGRSSTCAIQWLTQVLKRLKRLAMFVIADKLHHALFTCLNKFSKSWPVDSSNWKKIFQFLSATLFDRTDSGVCMVHMARHFNGIGLASKLDNETLAHQKKHMAAELLKLDGNLGSLPSQLKSILEADHKED